MVVKEAQRDRQMAEDMLDIRTDLALEARESLSENAGALRGITAETYEAGRLIFVTKVTVRTEAGARKIGKPKGIYVTLECAELPHGEKELRGEIAEVLAAQIMELLGERPGGVLIVGLGNRDMTADSLGPRVIAGLMITRGLGEDEGWQKEKTPKEKQEAKREEKPEEKKEEPKEKKSEEKEKARLSPDAEASEIWEAWYDRAGMTAVSGLIPGVLAQTGMETAEIVRGVVRETKPEAVLVIDALAAGSIHRLGTTIQLTDAGIQPGSGIGNHRSSLNRRTLGVPVIAIGVPMVVSAGAIIRDAGALMRELAAQMDAAGESPDAEGQPAEKSTLGELFQDCLSEQLYERMGETLAGLYVTPKDIDDTVKQVSLTIAEGLNRCFS